MEKKRTHSDWFIDKDSSHRWIYHRVKKHVLSVRTEFQKVEIIDTFEFGRIVVLDGRIQSAEADEFVYHEALVHPVMITHPAPESVLILGGGEGATLREVLRHPTVRKVIMVDIDREFVGICKKYLKKWHKGSFSDSRVDLLCEDAFGFLEESKGGFDAIIADISDPLEEGPAASIYTKEFYSLIRNALTPGGIFVTHATAVHYVSRENLSSCIFKALSGIFPKVDLYYEYIPSFGSLWSYIAASFDHSAKLVSSAAVERRLRERRLEDLSYYDGRTHQRLFMLPECLKKQLRNL